MVLSINICPYRDTERTFILSVRERGDEEGEEGERERESERDR